MSSQEAYDALINERDGTFLLRATKHGKLMFSVRRTMAAHDTKLGTSPVVHIAVYACEEMKWKVENKVYDTLEKMVFAFRCMNTSERFKHPYDRKRGSEKQEQEVMEEEKDDYYDDDGDDGGGDD